MGIAGMAAECTWQLCWQPPPHPQTNHPYPYRQQRLMAARVIATDVATWLLQPGGWRSHLTLVGGLDMSFLARDGAGGAAGTQHPPAAAVAALAVLSFPGLQLLHTELLRLDKLPAPYLPGFLGFRWA